MLIATLLLTFYLVVDEVVAQGQLWLYTDQGLLNPDLSYANARVHVLVNSFLVVTIRIKVTQL